MSDRSLPAYAKRLVALRMAGQHPLAVNVLYGDDWTPAREFWDAARAEPKACLAFSQQQCTKVPGPWLAIAPRQYAPGRLDWRCLAGVWVNVYAPHIIDAARFNALLAELAAQAGYVSIANGPYAGESASSLAFAEWVPGARQWPAWWPVELDREHERRRQAWTAEFLARSAARAAA